MAKRDKGGGAERPQALAGVPPELERWALAGTAPQRQSRSPGNRPSRPGARRATQRAARGLSRTVRNALPDSMGGGIAATAAVAIGAALIEVELLPGILLGAGAMLLGKAWPRLGKSARPMLKSVVAAGLSGYEKSRAAAAGAAGQTRQVIGEMRRQVAPPARKPSRPPGRRARGAAAAVAKEGASAAASAAPEMAAEAL